MVNDCEKNFKKITITTLVIIASLIFIPSVKAEEDYITLNQGPKDVVKENEKVKETFKEKYEKFQKELQVKYNSQKNPTTRSSVYESVQFMNYPNYAQEKNYYCGPATIKQALQFLTGSSLAQSTYASHMSTDSQGSTYVYQMTNELKRYLGSTAAFHEIAGTTTSEAIGNLQGYGQMQYVEGKPMILHSLTNTLYMYNGRSTGHYLTAIGYGGWHEGTFYMNNISEIVYVDTNTSNYGLGSVFGEFTDTVTNVANSVKNRYLILVN